MCFICLCLFVGGVDCVCLFVLTRFLVQIKGCKEGVFKQPPVVKNVKVRFWLPIWFFKLTPLKRQYMNGRVKDNLNSRFSMKNNFQLFGSGPSYWFGSRPAKKAELGQDITIKTLFSLMTKTQPRGPLGVRPN